MFSQYLYEDHKDFEPVTINGIRAKVIHYIPDGEIDHTGLPMFSGTSSMYLRAVQSGDVMQAKVYVDHRHAIDFDWSHEHRNKEGDKVKFPIGVVHVQEYTFNNDGELVRKSNEARLMTDAEIEKYGPIILHFNPNTKFRP